MILRVPTSVLAPLSETAEGAGVDLGVVAAVAIDQFGRLDLAARRGLIGEFLATATGPRQPLSLARLGMAHNAALAALWVFTQLPQEDRLALVERGGL